MLSQPSAFGLSELRARNKATTTAAKLAIDETHVAKSPQLMPLMHGGRSNITSPKWAKPNKAKPPEGGFVGSTLGRIRIVSVTILVANLAVPVVDHHLTPLIDSDFPGRFPGLLLGPMMRGIASIAFASHRPTVFPTHYMLIFTHDTPRCLGAACPKRIMLWSSWIVNSTSCG